MSSVLLYRSGARWALQILGYQWATYATATEARAWCRERGFSVHRRYGLDVK